MTICIAAICDDGRKIVVCADRMFTSYPLNLEFETAETKIEPVSRNCVALCSGPSAFATEILASVRNELSDADPARFADVVERVRSA